MASSVLRNATYNLLVASTVLTGLEYTANTILPAFTPDAPPEDRFCVLRWGQSQVGIGPLRRVTLRVWFYNRQPDMAPISDAIKETLELIPTLEAQRLSSTVAVADVNPEGDSEDLFDDGYRAHARWTQFTITGSGC